MTTSTPARMLPGELRAMIRQAGITQAAAAELAGISPRAIRQYLAGHRPIPQPVSRLLAVVLAAAP